MPCDVLGAGDDKHMTENLPLDLAAPQQRASPHAAAALAPLPCQNERQVRALEALGLLSAKQRSWCRTELASPGVW